MQAVLATPNQVLTERCSSIDQRRIFRDRKIKTPQKSQVKWQYVRSTSLVIPCFEKNFEEIVQASYLCIFMACLLLFFIFELQLDV